MEYSINNQDQKVICVLATTMVFYYIFYFLVTTKKTDLLFSKRWSDDSYYINSVLYNRFSGFIFLGIIPGILFFLLGILDFSELGVSFHRIANNWYWITGLPIMIIFINFFTARNPIVYRQYPQMRISKWNSALFFINALGWTFYLIGYEFLFRGAMLIVCTHAFGPWPAIAINISIYSAIHLTQGIKEAIGAIPFGFIVCLLMLNTGTIIIPIVLHLAQSLSNDYFSIRHNPEMKFIKSKRL